MKNLHMITLLAILIGFTTLAGAQKDSSKEMKNAKQIPLEDFFKNPEKSSYQISPNGEYFSFKAPYENRMNIFIQKRGEKEAIRLTEETDRDIAGYFWPNNEQILYVKDDGGNENYKLYGVNIDGSKPCLLY